ncbi:Phage protein [Hyphomicrobium sulfonivorans]|uniref:Phage protein n=1 Tax=Hyphomicrobium sulfonivorans TaxID=121290 RepID=A0A109BNB1_HYPSL|nr:TIGR02391 family protein [Hyphomicrobium sulfonivorans]KWT71919.1 Phage protein [Hyphomicrobium sulfonivorans]
MPVSLLNIFPRPQDLMAVAVEDLATVMFEFLRPDHSGRFSFVALIDQLFPLNPPSYPDASKEETMIALAEGLSWLETHGLVIKDPRQPNHFYILTRRAKALRGKADVESYRKGRILPVDLLGPRLVDKVQSQFLRGDYDVAVFQAFKEVEVATRKAARLGDDVLGVNVMRKAFHPEAGPLTDLTKLPGERESEMHMFSGAIGHAKNPGSHRDVAMSPTEAARLIIFASYLLSIVRQRSPEALPSL